MSVSIERRHLIYASVVALAIFLGIELRRNALGEGFASDDYLQFAMLEGVYPVERSPLDLFNFYRSPEEIKRLKQFGTLPWLSDPNFRLAMLRPLSSALTAFDFFAFGNNVHAFHLHSVFWWALMLVAVSLVLAEVLPLPAAAVSIVLFALDESNNFPFVWLANRNTSISLALGSIGVWAHIRWRRRGQKSALALSITAFILAVLGGEWVFALFAYIFAFELFEKQRPIRSRMIALIPATLIALGFIAAQSAFSYGALHSSVYVSPFSDPVAFLTKASRRVPVFFADIVLSIPTLWWHLESPWRQFILSLGIFSPEVWRVLPSWKFWHVFLGLVAIAIFVPIVVWGMRNSSSQVRNELRWLVVGALLSLLPLVSSIPSERLTLPSEIGLSALFSAVIIGAAQRLYRSYQIGTLKFQAMPLVILLGGLWFHCYRAATRSAFETEVHRYIYESVAQWVEQADIDDAKVTRQHIILINPIEHTTAVFLPFVRYALGHPLPVSCWTLSGAPNAHDVIRPAPNVLEVIVLGATSSPGADIENFYRDDRSPLKKGDIINLDGLKVEIIAVTRGSPWRVRFTFSRSLDDPEYLLLRSTRSGLRRFVLPPVGDRTRLPRAQFPSQNLLPRKVLRIREPNRTRERLKRWFGLL